MRCIENIQGLRAQEWDQDRNQGFEEHWLVRCKIRTRQEGSEGWSTNRASGTVTTGVFEAVCVIKNNRLFTCLKIGIFGLEKKLLFFQYLSW